MSREIVDEDDIESVRNFLDCCGKVDCFPIPPTDSSNNPNDPNYNPNRDRYVTRVTFKYHPFSVWNNGKTVDESFMNLYRKLKEKIWDMCNAVEIENDQRR